MNNQKTLASKLFGGFNTIFFILLSIATFYPFWYELCASFSSSEGLLRGGLLLWPRNFNLESYNFVLGSRYIWIAYKNSIFITIAGTILSVIITAALAYTVSKKNLPGKKVLIVFILVTLLFEGGIIPTYLVVRGLGLVNSLWALILLAIAGPYNLLVMRSFFVTLPEEMEESAFIDGANPIVIFFMIILPLSMPVIATVALWVAVGLWNNYFNGVMFLNERSKYILPVLLRDIIAGQDVFKEEGIISKTSSDTVIAATVVVALVPILCVYPFLQQFFVKGVMVGSVKG